MLARALTTTWPDLLQVVVLFLLAYTGAIVRAGPVRGSTRRTWWASPVCGVRARHLGRRPPGGWSQVDGVQGLTSVVIRPATWRWPVLLPAAFPYEPSGSEASYGD